MADSFSLPLRSVTKNDSTKNSLPVRIAQINSQRGSFRNVTEQSLQEEIEAAKARGSVEEEEELNRTGDDDNVPDRQEQLMKSRTEIMEFAAYGIDCIFPNPRCSFTKLIAIGKHMLRLLMPLILSPCSSQNIHHVKLRFPCPNT